MRHVNLFCLFDVPQGAQSLFSSTLDSSTMKKLFINLISEIYCEKL
ncbi:MAG: hypothetical protein OFPI_31290 [Osedax symbiont Rs2]|nr:MAG: hypothetical protein OFPI_31290 [Osedax symbiont Rs2]